MEIPTQRVQSAAVSHKSFFHHFQNELPRKEESISVGQWCAFHDESDIFIGRSLSFSYMSGSTVSAQQYSAFTAPTKPPKDKLRGIGCLCSWFKITSGGKLESVSMDIHGFFDIENYICNVPHPIVSGDTHYLSCTISSITSLSST